MARHKLLAITMGDPAGIGPEICLKAVADHHSPDFGLVLIGDASVFRRLAEQAGFWMPMVAHGVGSAAEIALVDGVSILNVDTLDSHWEPGRVDEHTGRASYRYITTAIEAALTGRVAGVVTAPIHKEALHQASVPYPGHTEIFEKLTGAGRACMLLTSDALSCSFVTTHVGLNQVPRLLSVQRILDVIELTHQAMQSIRQRLPRLVVCGLNPHAGENGLFGNGEEENIIVPAIEIARQQGISVEGPIPPDTAFLLSRRQRTDAYVCMYHDQGHIPLKALSFETAINITLGLPIVRTSVDHGTALDIAWRQFTADPTSMQQAITAAQKLCQASLSQSQDTPIAADVSAKDPRHEVTF